MFVPEMILKNVKKLSYLIYVNNVENDNLYTYTEIEMYQIAILKWTLIRPQFQVDLLTARYVILQSQQVICCIVVLVLFFLMTM